MVNNVAKIGSDEIYRANCTNYEITCLVSYSRIESSKSLDIDEVYIRKVFTFSIELDSSFYPLLQYRECRDSFVSITKI